MNSPQPDPILIAFDGDCLMCSRAIRFTAEHDRHDRIRFTRLQDETGRSMSGAFGGAPLDSMLVRSGNRVLDRSEAVIEVLENLGGFWRLPAMLGRLIPKSWRDRLYDFIANRRYQWFGKGDACALPSEAVRRRLMS